MRGRGGAAEDRIQVGETDVKAKCEGSMRAVWGRESVQRAALAASHLARYCRCGERDPVDLAPVEADLERVLSRGGQWQVEHQHRPGLNFGHAGRWLAELHPSIPFEQGASPVVDEPDPHRVIADLAAAAPHPEDEMGPRVHRGELGHPDVLKQPQD